MARAGDSKKRSARGQNAGRVEKKTVRDARHSARDGGRKAISPGSGFPVVGLGASAGGLQALDEFFGEMPARSGVAFVVVTHLQPDRPSLMRELLARKTTMPVIEVGSPTVVQADHVYLSSPGWNLAILNGVLHPMEPVKQLGHPLLSIDYFFRSLADDRKDHAVGIVLSGTGSDGTLGLKQIKANAGMVMAQQEASAGYAGMPHSAITTELMDFVLPAREMPGQLLKYLKASRLTRPSATRKPRAGTELPSEDLQQLFVLMRNRTGHDFSQYKESTIHRRVERRMNVHHLDSLKRYIRFLQEHPEDLDRLFKELLIGVTSFFRDPEAFEALAKTLPELIASRPANSAVRVWVPGCSTGEEAYSIAILLHECLNRLDKSLGVQIFASDLDADAIDVARKGRYPAGIAVDVTPERLERFFVFDKDTFRLKKEIRDMVVFAPQNLIGDPPFTKLDILSCRNLLIYLGAPLQKRVFPIFHYSLKPGGILFLGSSESASGFTNLFEPVDKKWKIYRRKEVPIGSYVADFSPTSRGASTRLAVPDVARPVALDVKLGLGADRLLLRELVAPTVLIRENGDVVHIHGRTGRFLEPAPGPQATSNVFNMARPGLELELGAAVRQAAARGREVVHRDVRIKSDGENLHFDLRVRCIKEPEPFRGLFLVTFEEARPKGVSAKGSTSEVPGKSRDRIADLEKELQHSKARHQLTTEDLESANEELQSTNEELQSTNEELQSANEELETSKEEMQSLNEELQTVNAELQGKLEELSQSNDDMKNLLNGTDIATLFLDNELNIKRYTEQAKRVIRLIPSDVGRPIGDLVAKLRYGKLVEDAREVLRTLKPKETELRGEGKVWYLMRILPYRTNENVIEGLVLTFVDITAIRALQQSERRLLEALEHSPTTVFGQDLDLRYIWSWNSVFGHKVDDLLGKTDADLLPADQARTLDDLKRGVIASGSPIRRRLTLTPGREDRVYDFYAEPLRADGDDILGVSCAMTDITDWSKG